MKLASRMRHVASATAIGVIIISASCRKSVAPSAEVSGETAPAVAVRREPSNDELIDAAVHAASADTTTRVRYRTASEQRSCTEMDVATDPYMPHNPELARCPEVGRRYTVTTQEPYQEQVKCPAPPREHQYWSVNPAGENVWRVSSGGRSWTVTQQGGAAVTTVQGEGSSVPSSSNREVKVSDFVFSVISDQGC